MVALKSCSHMLGRHTRKSLKNTRYASPNLYSPRQYLQVHQIKGREVTFAMLLLVDKAKRSSRARETKIYIQRSIASVKLW